MTLPHAIALAAAVLIGFSDAAPDSEAEPAAPARPNPVVHRPTIPAAGNLQCRRYFGCLPAERPLALIAKE